MGAFVRLFFGKHSKDSLQTEPENQAAQSRSLLSTFHPLVTLNRPSTHGRRSGARLSVVTAHVESSCWHGNTHMHTPPERAIWFTLLGREAAPAAPASFVNIWNEIRYSRGRLSLKIGIAQPCSRINPGCVLLSCCAPRVSIPNCLQSWLERKNKGLFFFFLCSH